MINRLLMFLSGMGMAFAQTYPPAAGVPGSTAINKNSSAFTAWATGIEVTRGFVTVANPQFIVNGSNYTSAGNPDYAIGRPDGGTVSLGDSGYAILTFASPVTDGDGFDFAVFENGTPGYLELAFVEASSDGINFFRFPAHSQTQTEAQIGTFGSPDPRYLNNLAGKYDGDYGTPFDISELPDNLLLDKENITHIKVIDVVGSINPLYAMYDSYGNAVNESFPTPFASGGFDLQGVGVIHQKVLGNKENGLADIKIHPNPVKDLLYINITGNYNIAVYDLYGRKNLFIRKGITQNNINLSELPTGFYIAEISTEYKTYIYKFIKE